ncbi:MAG: hypothetical protein GH151_12705 [Bacteroidetes bacterium]|nr:hypothetical protein [Bacteroidota bacterium]
MHAFTNRNSPPWKGGVPDRREGEVVDFLYLPLHPPPNTAPPSHTTADRQVKKTLAGYSLT